MEEMTTMNRLRNALIWVAVVIAIGSTVRAFSGGSLTGLGCPEIIQYSEKHVAGCRACQSARMPAQVAPRTAPRFDEYRCFPL
jgi:hypothetical protein